MVVSPRDQLNTRSIEAQIEIRCERKQLYKTAIMNVQELVNNLQHATFADWRDEEMTGTKDYTRREGIWSHLRPKDYVIAVV